MPETTYIRAIRDALFEEMRRDEKVFLMGESVRGGNYEHTVGLIDEFGSKRVIDTPICEPGIAGAGVGAAVVGSLSTFISVLLGIFIGQSYNNTIRNWCGDCGQA